MSLLSIVTHILAFLIGAVSARVIPALADWVASKLEN